jgi:hypothetical protein
LMPLGFSNRLPENPLSLLPPVLQSSFAAARLSTPRIVQNLEPTLAERLLLHSNQSLMGGAQQGYNPFAPVMRPMSLQAGHLERAFMAMQARDEQQLLSNKIQLTQHAMALYNSRGHTPLSITRPPHRSSPNPQERRRSTALRVVHLSCSTSPRTTCHSQNTSAWSETKLRFLKRPSRTSRLELRAGTALLYWVRSDFAVVTVRYYLDASEGRCTTQHDLIESIRRHKI